MNRLIKSLIAAAVILLAVTASLLVVGNQNSGVGGVRVNAEDHLLKVYVCGNMGCGECRSYINLLKASGFRFKLLNVCCNQCINLIRTLIVKGVTPSIPITILRSKSKQVKAVIVGPLSSVKLLQALMKLVSNGTYPELVKLTVNGGVRVYGIRELNGLIPVYQSASGSLRLIKLMRWR